MCGSFSIGREGGGGWGGIWLRKAREKQVEVWELMMVSSDVGDDKY